MRGVVSVAALAACTVVAFAAAYDDFTLGQRANVAGNSELAVTAFTNALNAPDLPAAYRPTAHVGRGTALARQGHCKEALADANEALKLNPQIFAAHVLRIQMDKCLDNDAALIADATEAIAAHKDDWPYAMRASALWRRGDFAGAAADYDQASDLSPRDPHLILWAAVAHMKAGNFDVRRFSDRTRRFDEDAWPGAIIAFYRGAMNLDAVRKAQSAEKPEETALRQCQADFFLGEWQLWRNDKAAAKELFASAAAICPASNGLVRQAAKKELLSLS